MAYAQPKNTALNSSSGTTATGLAVEGVVGACAGAGTLENRKEERCPADGSVCLILDHDGAEAVNGRLADVSQSGFRAVHRSRELNPGRVIRFHFEDRQSGQKRSGWARVVWTRVLDSVVETGCFIVIAD